MPTVLSWEEAARLINAAGTLFQRTLLMTLYATDTTLIQEQICVRARSVSTPGIGVENSFFAGRIQLENHPAPGESEQCGAASSTSWQRALSRVRG